MKKLIMMSVVLALAAAPALAQRATTVKKAHKDGGKMTMQDDRKDYEDLVAKYKKETDPAKKAAIKEQVKAKVSENYDKRLESMQPRVAEAKKNVSGMEDKLADAKKPEVKEQRVNEMTERILSGQPLMGGGKGGKFEGGKFEKGKNHKPYAKPDGTK